MHTKKALLSGSVTIFQTFCKALAVVLMARMYSASEFGMYSLALVFSTVGSVIVGWRLERALFREAALSSADVENLSCAVSLTLFFQLVYSTLSLALGRGAGLDSQFQILVFVCSFFPICNLSVLFEPFYLKAPGYKNFARINVIQIVASLIVKIALIGFKAPLVYIASAEVVVGLIRSAFLVYDFARFRFNVRISFKFGKISEKLLSISTPFAISGILIILNLRVDLLMVGGSLGIQDAAYYAAACQIPLTLPVLVIGFEKAFSFRSLKESKKSLENALVYIARVYAWVYWGTLIVAIMLSLSSSWLITELYGKNYSEAIIPFAVLSFVPAISALTRAESHVALIRGKTTGIVTRQLISISLNILLNFTLMPILGITGAAISTLASSIIVLIVSVWKDKMLRQTTCEVLLMPWYHLASHV